MSGMGNLLHSKEVSTKGDTLEMIVYNIRILPLMKKIQATHPLVTQPWYSDNAGARGEFENIHKHLEELIVRGLDIGYFPDLTNRILVVSGNNVQ